VFGQNDLNAFIGQIGHQADMVFVPMVMVKDQIYSQSVDCGAQVIGSEGHFMQGNAGQHCAPYATGLEKDVGFNITSQSYS
jgi:hypothetical protein